MKHIDEHTLELYVLKAREITDKIPDIEEHLRECEGCQALVAEMDMFYEDLKSELESVQETEISTEKSLVRSNVSLNPVFERNANTIYFRPSAPIAKIFYFVRRHPVVVGLSSFVLVAAFGWWLNSAKDSVHSFFKDKNAEEFSYNTENNSIVVVNKDGEKIWELEAENLNSVNNDILKYNTHYTLLEDLNNDGRKELITTVKTPADPPVASKFRVYDFKKGYIIDEYLYQPFEYLNRKHYSYSFDPNPILVYQSSDNAKKEIFLGAHNVGHSPFFIGRYDHEGKNIGRYWHFGTLNGIQSMDLNGDGHKEIIAYGQNDGQDTLNPSVSYAVIIVLDPLKIDGDKKSLLSGGYNFDYSDAELFYLRFPLTDINLKLHETSSILSIETAGTNNLKVTYEVSLDESDRPYLYYTLANDLKVLEIQPSDYYKKYHSKLVDSGLLKSYNLDKYLERLKNRVEYWDGKTWRSDWTSIEKNRP